MSDVSVFVGPRKTGTSWLHHVASGSTKAKEMRYPARFFRSYVYRRHVAGRSLLIWPYLLHEPACLDALLEDLATHDRSVRLYYSVRDDEALHRSMTMFLQKHGAPESVARERAGAELARVEACAAELARRHDLVRVRIIDADAADLEVLSDACGIPVATLEAARDTRVYESREGSRLPSHTLTELFFRLKPFLPEGLQEITKTRGLRRLFFQPRDGRGVRSDDAGR